jgi:hypothetical protein
MININIKTDNSAFGDSNYGAEVARILKQIAKDIEVTGGSRGSYQDINGNTVCKVTE